MALEAVHFLGGKVLGSFFVGQAELRVLEGLLKDALVLAVTFEPSHDEITLEASAGLHALEQHIVLGLIHDLRDLCPVDRTDWKTG